MHRGECYQYWPYIIGVQHLYTKNIHVVATLAVTTTTTTTSSYHYTSPHHSMLLPGTVLVQKMLALALLLILCFCPDSILMLIKCQDKTVHMDNIWLKPGPWIILVAKKPLYSKVVGGPLSFLETQPCRLTVHPVHVQQNVWLKLLVRPIR